MVWDRHCFWERTLQWENPELGRSFWREKLSFGAENSQDEVHESSTKRRYRMITQLSVVADASTHSGKEMLVSCAFAPTEKIGLLHAVIQHLNKDLKRSEVDVSTLAVIAKKRKLQRMSAFRQLQAIDTQLALLSDNHLGLNAFSYTQNEEEQEKGQADEAQRKNDKQIESLLKKKIFSIQGHEKSMAFGISGKRLGVGPIVLYWRSKNFDRYWHHVCNHVGTCLCFENVNIHQFRGAYRYVRQNKLFEWFSICVAIFRSTQQCTPEEKWTKSVFCALVQVYCQSRCWRCLWTMVCEPQGTWISSEPERILWKYI